MHCGRRALIQEGRQRRFMRRRAGRGDLRQHLLTGVAASALGDGQWRVCPRRARVLAGTSPAARSEPSYHRTVVGPGCVHTPRWAETIAGGTAGSSSPPPQSGRLFWGPVAATNHKEGPSASGGAVGEGCGWTGRSSYARRRAGGIAHENLPGRPGGLPQLRRRFCR